jgi:hypothetical protein
MTANHTHWLSGTAPQSSCGRPGALSQDRDAVTCRACLERARLTEARDALTLALDAKRPVAAQALADALRALAHDDLDLLRLGGGL